MARARTARTITVAIACLVFVGMIVVVLGLTALKASGVLPAGTVGVSVTWDQVQWEQGDTYGACAAGNGSFSGSIGDHKVTGALSESCGSNLIDGSGTLVGKQFSMTVTIPAPGDLYGSGGSNAAMQAQGTLDGHPFSASVQYDPSSHGYRIAGSVGSETLAGTATFHEDSDYYGGSLAGRVSISRCSLIC